MNFHLAVRLILSTSLISVGECYRFEALNKTFPVVEKDEAQVRGEVVTSNNLFGWLNLKNYVNFRLWTRLNPAKAQEIKDNEESVDTSNFDSKRLTKIIIHGYADSANEVYISDYLLRFRDEYLKFADVNVIVVDYSVYAMPMMYFTSLHEVVAEKLADVIEFLVKKDGVKLSSFHVIGMSWGAHVAGIAGHTLNRKLGGKLGRITGLDPAGPLFKFVENEFRLDKEDAEFVDIIHSNGGTRILFGGFFGLKDPLGHVDAYPNGGSTQIGCPQGRTLRYETLLCSHARVIGYYLESISSPLAFPMCPCKTFDAFVKDECPCKPEQFSFMGEHLSHKTRGIFQLITRPSYPYGHGPQMEVSLPDLKDPSDNKILRKRSHPKSAADGINGTSVNEVEDDAENPEETARVTYKNKTLRVGFNDEFSADKFPNDYVLQLCHLAQHSA